jgi:hypothetical protein
MKTLPQVTQNQLERMKQIKQAAIEADNCILPSSAKKLFKAALIETFELMEEIVISNGQLRTAVNL